MIDSVIFYGSGTKAGTKETVIADLKLSADLMAFVRSDEFDFSQIVRVEIVTQRQVVDANGNVITPRQTLNGFALLLATENTKAADAIWNFPNDICRVQFDRESGKVIRTRIPLATLRTLSVEPMFSGSRYQFDKIEAVA